MSKKDKKFREGVRWCRQRALSAIALAIKQYPEDVFKGDSQDSSSARFARQILRDVARRFLDKTSEMGTCSVSRHHSRNIFND